MPHLLDNPKLDQMAIGWLRDHRQGVDASEAYDDLRELLAQAHDVVYRLAAEKVGDFVRARHEGKQFRCLHMKVGDDGLCARCGTPTIVITSKNVKARRA